MDWFFIPSFLSLLKLDGFIDSFDGFGRGDTFVGRVRCLSCHQKDIDIFIGCICNILYSSKAKCIEAFGHNGNYDYFLGNYKEYVNGYGKLQFYHCSFLTVVSFRYYSQENEYSLRNLLSANRYKTFFETSLRAFFKSALQIRLRMFLNRPRKVSSRRIEKADKSIYDFLKFSWRKIH